MIADNYTSIMPRHRERNYIKYAISVFEDDARKSHMCIEY